MLRDFIRRLFFRRSTAYFLVSFLSSCAQIIFRTAFFVTDNDGARRKGVSVKLATSEALPGLYRLLSDSGFEYCLDVPGTCTTYDLDILTPNQCPMVTSYVVNKFRSNRLEDLVFVVLHIYLILVTIYALARESIPHVIFILVARFLSAVWALARVIETALSQETLIRLAGVCVSGATSKAASEDAFFGHSFFMRRRTLEVALLGASVLSVALEGHVAYKIGRVYTEKPWRVVQVSSEMRRMYRVLIHGAATNFSTPNCDVKLLLGFSVVMQVAGFILPATMALWVDQVLNTYFRRIVRGHIYIYGTVFLSLTILLPSWIALGWLALRREWKRSTYIFLGFGVIFSSTFISGLGSAMFKWTLATWRFFTTLYIISLILLIAIIALAILCRRNFGKNLDHYLIVQNRLSDMDFPHAHFEKDRKMDEWQIPHDSDTEVDCSTGVKGSDLVSSPGAV